MTMILLLATAEIMSEQDFRLIHPHVSFPNVLSDAALQPFGAQIVTEPVSIDALCSQKNAQINAWREQANSSVFIYAGKEVSADPLSMKDIMSVNGAVTLLGTMPAGWGGAWKAADNSYIPIPDSGVWKLFFMAMVAQGQVNFMRAQELKQQLAAATTAEQIDAIAW
jgi:hypothetical protein